MKISGINPNIQTLNKTPTCKGRLSKNTMLMMNEIQAGLSNAYNGAINKNNKFVLSVSQAEVVNKLANIFDNLNIIMERFGHNCVLDFERLERTQKHRFFIGSDFSYYKHIVGDVNLSGSGTPEDIEHLEKITNKLAEINPYETNTKFIIQKIPRSSVEDFKPDADYMFLEDKLIK